MCGLWAIRGDCCDEEQGGSQSVARIRGQVQSDHCKFWTSERQMKLRGKEVKGRD